MPVVTALRAQPRGRVAVDLDETPWRTLPAEPVVRAGLFVGCELDRPTARRLRRELRHAEALGVAVGSLRTRDLSTAAVLLLLLLPAAAAVFGIRALDKSLETPKET